jgi:hypothetical protein
MYLPIVSTIVDGQGLPTTVVIPGNNKKTKPYNIENIKLNSNELQHSQPQQHDLFRRQISNC